jgi:hypothetical protein
MADDKSKAPAPAAPAAEAAPAKKKPPIKTIGIVLALLVVEGAVVFFVASKLGGPTKAEGQEIVHEEDPSLDETAEVQIVADRFPNHNTGRVWLWDTEVQIKVKQRYLEEVQGVLEERAAEIRTGVSQIVRNAHHNHLKEPTLETLNRQMLTYLRGVFGQDPEGRERVEQVLIPKCVGFPSDF